MKKENTSSGVPKPLAVMGGIVAVFLLIAMVYVGYQAMRILNPPNTYETALTATVEDTVDAEGVLIFKETTVDGSGELGYLVEDGERVSSGTVVAEVYTSESQGELRTQLNDLNAQIDLLQRAQNVSSTQIDTLLSERSAALYNLLDAADRGEYEALEADKEEYLLAQNKLFVTTGEAVDFSGQIAALEAQAADLQAQLGAPAQITAPTTGYFISAGNTRQLTRSADELAALDAAGLKAALDEGTDTELTGCAGKLVSGFTWYYYGICSANQASKLLNADGRPLTGTVQIRFPGQTESTLKAKLTEVTVDEAAGVARFVLQCDTITGDVLRLGQAQAQIIVGQTTGLRVRATAVHYVLEQTGMEADSETLPDENYIPGVYVKFGSLARFCRIDPVDNDHPLVTDGDYIIVAPKGTEGSVSQVRLYDEIIVSGQNLYDGKLLR